MIKKTKSRLKIGFVPPPGSGVVGGGGVIEVASGRGVVVVAIFLLGVCRTAFAVGLRLWVNVFSSID